MITRAGLRLSAILIVLAGMADPVLTRAVTVRPPLAIVMMGEDTTAAARRLQALLADGYDTALKMFSPTSRAAACPSSGGCVMVSNGTTPRRLTAGATVIGALRIPDDGLRVIAGVEGPSTVHLDAASVLRVRLHRPAERVDVFDGDILVGSAEAGSTEIEVPWVPIAEGARALRVMAAGDLAHVGVVIEREPARVFVYEPEATWLGAFVRRALEGDARFALQGSTRVAPSVAIARGAATRLTADSLEGVASAVVAAPDALTSADVALLEAFVSRRGGSLVVIPDRRPTGPILRLLPRIREERPEADPQVIGSLRATELLVFDEGADTTTLAAAGSRAIVVARAIGRGQVIVSGALDAWRHRGDTRGFQSYWTTLLWEASVAAGPPLRVSVNRALIAPGEDVDVEVDIQTLGALPAELVAAATFECGGDRGILRLWPGARRGTFAGVFRPNHLGPCRLVASAGGLSSSVSVAVATEIQPMRADNGRLEAAIGAHGGVVVTAGQEDELASRVRQQLPPRREWIATRPMRSPLWIIPFVACLGAEWWSRRQVGLR